MEKDIAMPHLRTPMAVRTEVLQDKGFTQEFQITEKGLSALNTGRIYQPADLKILEHFRYEGIADPDDEAVLYAVETRDGLKGIIVDAFGIYANTELSDFMKGVKDLTVKGF